MNCEFSFDKLRIIYPLEPPVQISKPKITLNLAHEVLYNTETVTLGCEVPGEPPGLQYDWYKDSSDLDEHQPSITARGSGKYECKAKKGATESEKSDSYTLTLEGKWISQMFI